MNYDESVELLSTGGGVKVKDVVSLKQPKKTTHFDLEKLLSGNQPRGTLFPFSLFFCCKFRPRVIERLEHSLDLV